jgi:NAD(P)-dependent dehydrogenase (short-subunit alcohol dehydrogenase family)
MVRSKQNKVVMITGAAGALGSELALLCAGASWDTVLLDRNQPKLESLYDRIEKARGAEPSMVVMDLAAVGPEQCREVANALETGPGRLDALIHCAASFEGLQPLEQIQPQDWLRQIQVNLNAPWLLSTSCLPLLRQSPQASLYFISEDMDRMSAAYWGAYGVSKHGINTLASQFAAELGHTNIQVLALNPGAMRSPLRAKVYHSENPGTLEMPLSVATKILGLMERRLHASSFELSLADLGNPGDNG